jgi:EpsI family protein
VFLEGDKAKVARERTLASFPVSIGGWVGSDQEFPNSILKILLVDEYIMRKFTKGNNSIWLYIGYYNNESKGGPHSPRHCYPGSGFNPIKNEIISIPVVRTGRDKINPNKYVFARGMEREIVIYWYQARGRVISDEYAEKYYVIRDKIFRKRSDEALIRFSIAATAETEEAQGKLLESFVSTVYPEIPKVVPD